jgi:integrase
MVHHFLRSMGLLNFPDLATFRTHVMSMSPPAIQEQCAAFADRLCASSKSVCAYVRIFNLLFVDVFAIVSHRFSVPRRRHRIISIAELDDMLSTTSSTVACSNGGGGRPHRTDHFTVDEMEQLLRVAEESGIRDHLMMALLATTGLRRRGLLNIRTTDVAQISDVDHHWRADVAGNTREKGGKMRSFPLFPSVQVLIEKWLNTPAVHGGRPSGGPSPYLFPSSRGDGGQLSTSALSNAFRKICHRGGFTDHRTHLHAMRHSCAHRLLDSGNTPRQIAAYLGHSSASTTEKYYLRENPTDVTKHMHLPTEWTPHTETEGQNGGLRSIPVRDSLRELLAARNHRHRTSFG